LAARTSSLRTFGIGVLTAVDLDNQSIAEANEIQNVIPKGDLPTKLEFREPTIAQQPPHGCFRISWLAAHRPCEFAAALGDWPVVW
jgi:hypothetical protein